ncbi:U-box domain-containing protein 3 [Tanacetum coccineum]
MGDWHLSLENGFDRQSFQKSNHRSPEESCSHSRSESTSTAVSSSEQLYESSEHLQSTCSNRMDDLKRDGSNLIGQSGAVKPLISLLRSSVKITQEHAVTALLNLSINENIKSMIAESGAVEYPLIHEDYRVKIGQSGAVKPLVDLLGKGTLRGKKDAATALFNLSIFHENKARIIQAGAVKYLVELMDPESQMVDKSVALLSNLASVSERVFGNWQEKVGSRYWLRLWKRFLIGKSKCCFYTFATCLSSLNIVGWFSDGAVPPMVACPVVELQEQGEGLLLFVVKKAQQLLSHFRSQRENSSGRGES